MVVFFKYINDSLKRSVLNINDRADRKGRAQHEAGKIQVGDEEKLLAEGQVSSRFDHTPPWAFSLSGDF